MEVTPKLIELSQIIMNGLNFVKDVRIWNSDRNPTITLAVNLLQAKTYIRTSGHALEGIARRLGVVPTCTLENVLRDIRRDKDHFNTTYEFLIALKEVISDALNISGDDFRLTIQPVIGQPWNFQDDPISYYSVKKGKYLTSEAPPMIVPELSYYDSDEGKHVNFPVIDWCKVVPRVEVPAQHLTLFCDNVNYIVSHCFVSLNGLEKAIKHCNGLLFPSVSAGLVSSNNFGPYTLILDPKIVLAGLKPYRTTKGEYPVHVYKTDAWTVSTSGFFGYKGRQALLEWTGNLDGRVDLDFNLLLDWDVDDQEPLRNSKQLASRLKKLKRLWNDPKKQVEKLEFKDDGTNYPYMEAKVNGIVPLSACKLALAPQEHVAKLKAILKKGGFKGQVIAVPGLSTEEIFYPASQEKQPLTKWTRQQQWDYGWKVRELILKAVNKDHYLEHHLMVTNPDEPTWPPDTSNRTYYHGSNEELHKFGKTKKWIAFDRQETDMPIWLSPDKKFAGYGHKYTSTVDYDLSDKKVFPDQDILAWKGTFYGYAPLGQEIVKDIESGVLFPGCNLDNLEELLKSIDNLDYDILETKSFMDWLKARGYDGFWVRGDGPTNLAIFDPRSVKINACALSRP